MIWMMATMVCMIGIVSLGIDVGRIHLAKTEMRRSADASARAAANALPGGSNAVRTAARNLANNNTFSDTSVPLALANGDIIRGKWDTSTRTLNTNSNSPDAVRIIARRTKATNNPLEMTWASLFGYKTVDLTVIATAMYITPINVEHSAPGTSNPFLAGMPAGSVASLNNPHNSPDYTGVNGKVNAGPVAVSGLPLVPGTELTFDQIAGTVRHDPGLPYFNPDGQLNSIGGNTNGNENGISEVIAPINSLVGVFLTDESPTEYMRNRTAPERLNFSTPASRDFTQLEPKVQQIFWIGDSRTSGGQVQKFKIPPGATRLYLATWDFYEWNNNDGDRTVRITRPGRTVLVE